MDRPPVSSPGEAPLYQRVKDHVAGLIGRGQLGPGDRVPSEHELVALFRVSRMTANRALRELTAEGWLFRIPGLGSFVAPQRAPATILEIPDPVADAIARGGRHQLETLLAGPARAPASIAAIFGLTAGTALFRGRWRHRVDGRPLLVEDRWILPALAPDAPQATPSVLVPHEQLDHSLRASLPPPDIAGALSLESGSACLLMTRTARLGGRTCTFSEFWLPGDRITLTGTSRSAAQ